MNKLYNQYYNFIRNYFDFYLINKIYKYLNKNIKLNQTSYLNLLGYIYF